MRTEIPLPEAWCSRMKESLGDEFPAFINAHALDSPVSIRLNPTKVAELPYEGMKPVSWSTHGRYLVHRPVFTLDPLFHAGAYYVQEAGSMLIDELIRTIPLQNKQLFALDLCAAPGGKSLTLLDSIARDGCLVTNEPISSRNDVLRHNISKWGRSNVIVTQSEARHFSGEARFDVILVDAPCSGEGLFRKDHAARSEWTPERAQVCALRQQKILTDIYPALKPGGFLIYSTCTYNPEENDTCLDDFISKHPIEAIRIDPPTGVKQTRWGWQAFPHRLFGEGFYCSLLRKEGNWSESEFHFAHPSSTLHKHWENVLSETDDMLYREERIGTVAFTAAVGRMLDSLSGQVQIRQYGTPLGTLKREQVIPSAELALSGLVSKFVKPVDLTREQALLFLSGDTRFTSGTASGWHLIRHGGLAMGWAKWVGNRWNNHYPAPWRIRMAVK